MGLYQPPDFENRQTCKMMVATRADFDYAAAVQRGARLNVATKYVDTAREHFAAKGMHVNLIKLYGSMELAPLTGLADAIVFRSVSTGSTLKANNWWLLRDHADLIAPSSSIAAMKVKRARLQPLIEAFERAAA